MAPGFSVYLNSLGKMATSMDGASDAFGEVAQIAGGEGRVASNALGFFGGLCNFPQKYSAMCDNVETGAIQTSRALSKAADEFVALERRYAARDDFYAKKFHIQADNIKPNIPDLDGGASGKDEGGPPGNGSGPSGGTPGGSSAPGGSGPGGDGNPGSGAPGQPKAPTQPIQI